MLETGFGEEEGRLFQADGGLRCQSHPDATDVGLRPVEVEIAEDAGKRRLVEAPPEEIGALAQVRGSVASDATGSVKRRTLVTSE